MMEEKKLTGFPSIDKPWLKYHAPKRVLFDVDATIYQNFQRIARPLADDPAIICYRTNQRITFGALLSQIDNFANGLTALDIRKNDKVVALTFNSMIDPVILLGANKIGAVIEFLDPDADIAQMQNHASNARILVAEGVFLPLAKKVCRNIPIVVYGNSAVTCCDTVFGYAEFLNKGMHAASEMNDDKNLPALIIFSSGSTGAPKPIVHSSYSVNSAVQKMLLSDFSLDAHHLMARTIPSFIGLGVVTSMLVALMAGMPQIVLGTIDESNFDFETSDRNLIAIYTVPETFEFIKHYSNWINANRLVEYRGLAFFAAPIFFKFMISQAQTITDMSFFKSILLGGSKMSAEELALMETVFGAKGLGVPIGIGYGQNELCGAVTLNTVHHNKNGSAGYPVFKTVIKIVDRDTHEEIGYYQEGLILEQSNSAFLYYDNMPTETEKTKVILSDGSEWYNSNDLGYMDEDGFLFITGRTNRVVIKSDHKVSLDVVENKIKNIEGINDAAVVPYVNGNNDGDTVVFAELNNEALTLETINESIHGLTVFELPVKLVALKALPRMNNGKIDYRTLEKEVTRL